MTFVRSKRVHLEGLTRGQNLTTHLTHYSTILDMLRLDVICNNVFGLSHEQTVSTAKLAATVLNCFVMDQTINLFEN